MPPYDFSSELARFGPHSTAPRPTLAESRAYCRSLARGHYENFVVASLLLPRAMRQHFFHVYAYCRWADDLADECDSPTESLALLDWWQTELDACYAGRTTHPVFQALRETILEFNIPRGEFADLLVAFRRDQQPKGYATYAELLDYCRYSANPVGHLVLYLGQGADPVLLRLADRICTGLQLVNFWQDVARDYERGRVYLPHDLCQEHGYRLETMSQRSATPEFCRLLADLCGRAEAELLAGRPLVALAPRVLRGDVWLFIEGGLRTLQGIRHLGYDVWSRRPTVSRLARLGLLLRSLWPGGKSFSSVKASGEHEGSHS